MKLSAAEELIVQAILVAYWNIYITAFHQFLDFSKHLFLKTKILL